MLDSPEGVLPTTDLREVFRSPLQKAREKVASALRLGKPKSTAAGQHANDNNPPTREATENSQTQKDETNPIAKLQRTLSSLEDKVLFHTQEITPELVDDLIASQDILSEIAQNGDAQPVMDTIKSLVQAANLTYLQAKHFPDELPHIAKLHEFSSSFLVDHGKTLIKRLVESGDRKITIDALRYFASFGSKLLDIDEPKRERIASLLRDNLPFAVDTINNHQEFEYAKDIVDTLYINDREQLRQQIDHYLSSEDRNQQLTGRIIMALYIDADMRMTQGNEVYLLDEGRQLLETIREYGFDPDSLPYIWDRNSSRHQISSWKEMIDYRMKNIVAMTSLERQIPGICKVLYDQFGIRNFARYPTDLIIKQYQERDQTDLPYGISIYPIDDWNGCFSTTDIPQEVQRVLGQENENGASPYNMRMRYLEVGGKFELARILVSLNRKYGSNSKIAFAILSGHGSYNSIQLGANSDYYTGSTMIKANSILTIHDLGGDGSISMRKFFAPDATIILQSCSTAKDTGDKEPIAQQISSSLGFTVIAPQHDASMESIRVNTEANGNPQFLVTYSGDVGSFPGTTYRNGIKIG